MRSPPVQGAALGLATDELSHQSPLLALAGDMSVVTTSILIVVALLLIALAVVYFGLVRRRRHS